MTIYTSHEEYHKAMVAYLHWIADFYDYHGCLPENMSSDEWMDLLDADQIMEKPAYSPVYTKEN